MERLYRHKIIVRGALSLGIFFVLLIGGASYLFINTGNSIVERLIKEEKRYAAGIIELKSKELINELEEKVRSNLDTVSDLIAGFLYNYETEAIKEALLPFFNLPEVVSLELIEQPLGKSSMRMMKEEYDGTEKYGKFETTVVYNGETLGRLVAEYSNKEIRKKAYDQNRAMEQSQALIQQRVTETAYHQMARYAIYFGLGLLMVMGGVMWVLLYLDREVSRKSDALETINNELENRVNEEIRKNRDKEQLMVEQSKMAAMGEMIGAIAHQWRQPLNALGLYIQDLEDAYKFNELDLQYIQNTIRDSMRQIGFMSKTIDDFRNFFKPSKEKESFAVRSAIEEVLQIFSAQLKNNNIDVEISCDSQTPYQIFGRKNEFMQVILILINNAKDAIKAYKAANTDPDYSGKIRFEISQKINLLNLIVCDNGGGIDASILPRLFTPYLTTKGEQGTGIGLKLAKTIIETGFNGTIMAGNRNGGACFDIQINPE